MTTETGNTTRPLALLGTRENQLDGKGRLTVPAPFRQTDKEGWQGVVYVAPGLDPAERFLEIYLAPVWQALYEHVKTLPQPAQRQAMMRGFINRAIEVKLDIQGRFVLPLSLRDYAGLSEDVAWVAQDDHLELWAKDRLDAAHEAQRALAHRIWLENQDHFAK